MTPPEIVAVAVLIVSLPASFLWFRKQRAEEISRREQFVAGRPPIDDASFARMIGADREDVALVIAIRKAMGRLCLIPAEVIRGDDSTVELCRIVHGPMGDGWDDLGFLIELEDELGFS